MKLLFILLLSTCCFAINPRTSWTSGEFRDSLQIDSLKSAPVVGTNAHGKFIVGTATVPDSFSNTAVKSHRGWFDSIYTYAIYGLDSLRINHGVVISGDLYAGGNVRFGSLGTGVLQSNFAGQITSDSLNTVCSKNSTSLALQSLNSIYLQSKGFLLDSWHDMIVTNITGTTINTYLYCPSKFYADTAAFRTIGSLVKTDSINAIKGIKAPVFTGHLSGFGDSTAKVPDTVAFRLGISANTFRARSLGLGIGHFNAVGNLTSSNLTAAECAAAVSGTTNYVAKFTGANVVGNSLIYDNGNIGIGTTSPPSALSVFSGATGNSVPLYISNNTGTAKANSTSLTLARNFSPMGRITASNLIDGDFSYGYIAFETQTSAGLGMTEKFRIDNAGNVGIGTSAPNATLTVKGNQADTGNFFVSGDAYTTPETDCHVYANVQGYSSITTNQCLYKKLGNTIKIWFTFDGTSNSSATSFMLPYYPSTNYAATQHFIGYGYNTYGSTTDFPINITIITNVSSATIAVMTGSNAFGTSGTKRVSGSFDYETNNVAVT
jgi:hypothetical protein